MLLTRDFHWTVLSVMVKCFWTAFAKLFDAISLGRVLTQNSPVIPPRTITLTEPHAASLQSLPGKKIAISPMKTPSKVDDSLLTTFSLELGWYLLPLVLARTHACCIMEWSLTLTELIGQNGSEKVCHLKSTMSSFHFNKKNMFDFDSHMDINVMPLSHPLFHILGDCGVCGFPDVKHQPEVGDASCQCSTGPADPHSPAAGLLVPSQSGHQPDHCTG